MTMMIAMTVTSMTALFVARTALGLISCVLLLYGQVCGVEKPKCYKQTNKQTLRQTQILTQNHFHAPTSLGILNTWTQRRHDKQALLLLFFFVKLRELACQIELSAFLSNTKLALLIIKAFHVCGIELKQTSCVFSTLLLLILLPKLLYFSVCCFWVFGFANF